MKLNVLALSLAVLCTSAFSPRKPNSLHRGRSLPKSRAKPQTQVESVLSQRQQWALTDNVPKYTVNREVCLWRRLVDEVPELSGCSISEVRTEWLRIVALEQGNTTAEKGGGEATVLLSPPLLDEWLWKGDSVSGLLYDAPLVADGSPVTTRPVVEPSAGSSFRTAYDCAVMKGYVVVSEQTRGIQTGSSTTVLELGQPHQIEETEGNPFLELMAGMSGEGSPVVSSQSGRMSRDLPTESNSWRDAGSASIAIGSSAVALAGAMSVLSSHMTLQMFWVS
uniref:Subtilisin n=1 Tax=Octactis speculum TaxID=3111310 RepID=A0A7S2DSQ5_9STRA|mmetsp:Transcript_53701/g.73364  ORF Transcript_53701/g.73364 Transcript_53701/m.73364 type:complete len:279 (+) Transcript_53701:28-864(+)